MVVIGAAGSLTQADIMCAVLGSSGIEAVILDENVSSVMGHLTFALTPHGIRIAVPIGDAEEAAQILKPKQDGWGSIDVEAGTELRDKEPDEPLTAEQCALKAYRAAFLSWCLPPAALLTAYWLVRALSARSQSENVKASTFAKHTLTAFLVGILLPACIVVLALWAVAG